jgi:hypothetical protein
VKATEINRIGRLVTRKKSLEILLSFNRYKIKPMLGADEY